MRIHDYGHGKVYAYYEEDDLAECRACGVRPIYKEGSGNGGAYVRCPSCGIKTGTSTSGLEGVLPVWNRIMVDDWQDPKEGV